MSTALPVRTPDSEAPSPPELSSPPSPDNEACRRKHGWTIAAAVVLLAAAVLTAVLLSRRTARHAQTAGTSATPGQVLRLKGTTEAVQSRGILAPMLAGQQVGTLTIVHLTPGGTHVKKGNLLVEFDRQAQMRDFIDKQAEYTKLVQQVAQEQAKEVAARAKDETELKQAEDSWRKAELEIQKSELLSKIDAEKAQETLDESKATLAQLRETFDLKRKAAQAAIRILEIQRDRTEQTMLHARANADLMQIHSPIDGVVVLNTIWKEGVMGEVQEGDQVRPGVPFMQVVNPAAMQVRVNANQQDFPRLAIGQTAKVRLDAYPDLVFRARVDQLAPIAERGSFSERVRVFSVIVSIEGSDPKLMPDLSAAVDVDTTERRAGGGALEAGGGS